jgi:hypothetical protein
MPVLTRPRTEGASAAGPQAPTRGGWSSGSILGALLALGLTLRVIGLTSFIFEQDELYSIVESRALYASPLQPGIGARPLYYLIQHVVLELFPATPLSLRALPLLFGVLGIWATWALARQLFGGGAAALAAFLVAISPWHVHASGMARYWSLVYLLSALFCLALARASTTERPRAYHLALVVFLAGALSHPTFLFPAAGVALGLCCVRESGRLAWRWPSRAAWVHLWIPALAFLGLACAVLLLRHEASSVRNFSGRGHLAALRLLPAMVEWMTPTVAAAGGLGALVVWKGRGGLQQGRWGGVALLACLFSCSVLYAAALVTNVYADYGIAILPLVYVSAGGLIQLAGERFGAGRWVLGAVSAVILAAGILPSTVSNLYDGMRFDYRPAFSEISASGTRIPVLTWPLVLQRYYAPALRAEELVLDRASLDAALRRYADFWAVVSVQRYGILKDDSGEGAAWLAEHCRLHSSHQRARLDYRVYRVDLYRCRARD